MLAAKLFRQGLSYLPSGHGGGNPRDAAEQSTVVTMPE